MGRRPSWQLRIAALCFALGMLLIFVTVLRVAAQRSSTVVMVPATEVATALEAAVEDPTVELTPTSLPTPTDAPPTVAPRVIDLPTPTDLPTSTFTPEPTEAAASTPEPTATSGPAAYPGPDAEPTTEPRPLPPSFNNCQADPNAEAAPNYPIAIDMIDKAAETVTLSNESDEAIDLSGWRMCSITGNQEHPISGSLAASETRDFPSNEGDTWNNSETDAGALYNPDGQLVSYWFDG